MANKTSAVFMTLIILHSNQLKISKKLLVSATKQEPVTNGLMIHHFIQELSSLM